jgi:hypothetical protein
VFLDWPLISKFDRSESDLAIVNDPALFEIKGVDGKWGRIRFKMGVYGSDFRFWLDKYTTN